MPFRRIFLFPLNVIHDNLSFNCLLKSPLCFFLFGLFRNTRCILGQDTGLGNHPSVFLSATSSCWFPSMHGDPAPLRLYWWKSLGSFLVNLIKEGRVSLAQNDRFTSYTGHFRGLVCKGTSQTGGWGQGGAEVVEGT